MKREATYLTTVSIVAAFLLALLITAPARAIAPIIGNQTKSIAENTANGLSPNPSQITAADPEGQPLIYDIVGGDRQAAFSGNASTGVLNVKASTPPDHEVKKSSTLQVPVTATEPQRSDATITINLLDQPDTDSLAFENVRTDLAARLVQPANVTTLLDISSLPIIDSHKLEGLVILSHDEIALSNDNDFGIGENQSGELSKVWVVHVPGLPLAKHEVHSATVRARIHGKAE